MKKKMVALLCATMFFCLTCSILYGETRGTLDVSVGMIPKGEVRVLNVNIEKGGVKKYVQAVIQGGDSAEKAAERISEAINGTFPDTAKAVGTIVQVTGATELSVINQDRVNVTINVEKFEKMNGRTAGILGFEANPFSGADTLLSDQTITAGFNDGPGGLDLVTVYAHTGATLQDLALLLNDALSNEGYVTSLLGAYITVFADGAEEPTRLDFLMTANGIIGDNVIETEINMVPIPPAIILFCSGLMGLMWGRRTFRK
ncbi:MAG: hypothetical protein ABFD08_01320 [Syntrophomonas sp.]